MMAMSKPEARRFLREAREKAAAEQETAEEEPASVLEQAATLMRQRAQDAYPGPWTSDENDDCWRLHSAPDRRFPTAQILKAPKHGTPYAEYWPDKPTGEHIVSWHPGVALAVADWLDSWAGIEWDPQKYRSSNQEAAWRVAHVYLGFEMRMPLASPQAAYGDCGCRVRECECRGEVKGEGRVVSDGIVEFIEAQLALDEKLALATTPVPVPGQWRAAQDKHAADDAPLSLIQGCDEYDRDPDYISYSYGNPVIVHGADWQDESEANLRHIARHDPASVSAEIEAKRYLLEWCAEVTAHFDWSTLNQPASLKNDPNARATHTAVVALQSMAAPYIGRPGFKPEWRLP